ARTRRSSPGRHGLPGACTAHRPPDQRSLRMVRRRPRSRARRSSRPSRRRPCARLATGRRSRTRDTAVRAGHNDEPVGPSPPGGRLETASAGAGARRSSARAHSPRCRPRRCPSEAVPPRGGGGRGGFSRRRAAGRGVAVVTNDRSTLRDKRALVTGGSRGLGRALCPQRAADGAGVAFTYARDEAGAASTLEAIRATGTEGRTFNVSVLDASATAAMVQELETAWGGVEILVNNASISQNLPLAL